MDSNEPTPAPMATDSTPPAPPPPSSTLPQSSTTTETPDIPSSSSNPNPNDTNTNPNQSIQPLTPIQHLQQQQQQQSSNLQQSQIRAPISRIRPHQPYSQFPDQISSLPSSSSSSSSVSASPMQRGGIAIGVPATHARPPTPQSPSFSSFGSSSFNQQFGGLGRSVSMPDSIASSNPNQGMQNMGGMMSPLSAASQLRPSGVSSHFQQRAVQSSMRPQPPSNNQTVAAQKFQGQGSQSLLRLSSIGSAGSPSPGTPTGGQPHTQPWMSATTPGKQMPPPSMPSPSFRQQMKPQSLQQRSHLPQQHHHPLSTVSHQQMPSASQQQQQPSQLNQSQEHYGQQFPPPRNQQHLPPQPTSMRSLGPGNQKSSLMVQSGPVNSVVNVDQEEPTNQILSKRSIHELITQIDPYEKFDPEVEDILVEIAEDFVESTTTFACSLAKHRKSSVLEAKDILLHLERNWNMSLPGFGGDEIKNYKKPFTNDIHRERLAAIKKSMMGSDAAYPKSTVGQATGSGKGHTAKAPPIGSPKARDMP